MAKKRTYGEKNKISLSHDRRLPEGKPSNRRDSSRQQPGETCKLFIVVKKGDIMNERAIRVLEFDKIREMLVHYTGSTLGRDKAGKLMPAETLEEADLWQLEAEDATKRIDRKGSLSFGGIGDVGA